MGEALAQVEDLGDIELGAPVEVEDLGDIEIGEEIEVEETLPQVIAEEEDLGDVEIGEPIEIEEELPQVIGEEDSANLNLSGITKEPTFLTDSQQAWIDEQKQQGRESFEAAANRLSMENFEKSMKFLDIPHSVVKAAMIAHSQGASASEIAEIASQQVTDWEKVRAPEYGELIFQAAVNSGVDPSFARGTANVFGGPADLIGGSVIDPLNLVSPLSKIKPVKKLVSGAKKIAMGAPIDWGKNVVKKFVTAGVELTPKQFDTYLGRFKEIEAMSETDLNDISKNIGEAFENLQDLTYDKAKAARELLTEADGGINSNQIKLGLDDALRKVKVVFGEGSEGATTAFNRFYRKIDDAAERVARGVDIVEQTKGLKPLIELDEFGKPIKVAPIVADIPMEEVKMMISQLDNDIRTTNKLLSAEDDKTKFYLTVRQNIDALLKKANPEYEKDMISVAEDMKNLAFIRDRLGATKKFGVSDKLSGQALKGVATNPKARDRQIGALSVIDKMTGENFLENVNDRYMFDLMQQTSTRGASKAVAGAGVGGTIGGLVSLVLPTDPITKLVTISTLAGMGTIAGKMADTYGRPAVRALAKEVFSSKSFVEKYGLSLKSSIPGLETVSKISNNGLIKHFKPGIVRSFVSRYVDGDYDRFTDQGDIQITDYDVIQSALSSIAADPKMGTVQKYKMISGINAEFLENERITLKFDDNRKSKVLKGRKIPEDFFAEPKTMGSPDSGWTHDTEAFQINRKTGKEEKPEGYDDITQGQPDTGWGGEDAREIKRKKK